MKLLSQNLIVCLQWIFTQNFNDTSSADNNAHFQHQPTELYTCQDTFQSDTSIVHLRLKSMCMQISSSCLCIC